MAFRCHSKVYTAAISDGSTLPPPPLLLSQGNPLDFLLERRLEQLEQKVCLPAVGGIVVQTENHSLHELGGSVLRHLEDQLGQIDGLSLRTIGETEGWERSWRTSDQTSCKGFPDMGENMAFPGRWK